MKYFVALVFMVVLGAVSAQTKEVLFLGNSYTGVNNLPQLVADVALSTGDTLIHDKNTPGGYTFEAHATNATTLDKISQGNWDFVVLQEQSQRPSFPIGQVMEEVYPYAEQLDSLINAANPCAETIFYMTWGRKNGDQGNCAAWPPVCTYQGMDSLLNLRYRTMAEDNHALVSPVGALWNYIRFTYPDIELYAADESHPSLAGSYAAACSFYSVIFRKDPVNITFDSSLDPVVAQQIRSAAKVVVYDDLLEWNVGSYDVTADFEYTVTLEEDNTYIIDFENNSTNVESQVWSFSQVVEDSDLFEPSIHVQGITFQVTLTNIAGCDTVEYSEVIVLNPMDVGEFDPVKTVVYPIPTADLLNFDTDKALDHPILKVYSSIGQVIFEKKFSMKDANHFLLDVSSFQNGLFLYEIMEQDKVISRGEFVKN